MFRARRRTAVDKSRAKKGYNPEEERDRKLRSTYGITHDEYLQQLEAQDNKCAICQSTEAGGRHNTFAVDHDHATGAVRGLLCSNCNLGIGYLQDDVTRLAAAITYLNEGGAW